MRRNLVIIGLVGALGVAALVDGIRRSEQGDVQAVAASETASEGDELRGPDVPAPGALSGSLVIAAPGECRLREIDLRTVAYRATGPETACEIWPSPSGEVAIAQTSRGETAGTREISLIRLGETPETERSLGAARGNVAWSADGARAAWCRGDGSSTVMTLSSGQLETVSGCRPRFDPDGSVLTLPDEEFLGQLWRDGSVELDAADVARGFDTDVAGPVDIMEFDVAPDGLLALTVSKRAPIGTLVALELWRGDELVASGPLPARAGRGDTRLGELLRFGPDGRELAIGFGGAPNGVTIIDLGTGQLVLRAAEQRAFTWSPDGQWLAVAAGDEIRVYGAVRDVPVYVLPVETATLGWVPGEEPPPEE